MTTDIVTSAEEPKRSDAYIKLLEELKYSFFKAGEMVLILYEQGKKDGLPNHIIRKDIETALDGIVKERRLRELLPLELKRSYGTPTPAAASIDNSALIAESNLSSSIQESAGLNVHILPEYEAINSDANSQTDRYFEALKAYVERNSPRTTIIINEDGLILDGHKTFRICNELGITPAYEVRSFEDDLAEKEFIIDSHLNPDLRDWQKACLLLKLQKEVYKPGILRGYPRYLGPARGIWFHDIMVAIELRGTMIEILCLLCHLVDKKQDPWVIPAPQHVSSNKDMTYTKHLLEHLENDGLSRYISHLPRHERYIDKRTHAWKFKDFPEDDLVDDEMDEE